MDYIEYKFWSAIAIVVLAFFAGLFGFIETGGRGPKAGSDKPPE